MVGLGPEAGAGAGRKSRVINQNEGYTMPRQCERDVEITPAMVKRGAEELERMLFDLHCDPSLHGRSEVAALVYRAMFLARLESCRE
jgi:hypothetical protein